MRVVVATNSACCQQNEAMDYKRGHLLQSTIVFRGSVLILHPCSLAGELSFSFGPNPFSAIQCRSNSDQWGNGEILLDDSY